MSSPWPSSRRPPVLLPLGRAARSCRSPGPPVLLAAPSVSGLQGSLGVACPPSSSCSSCSSSSRPCSSCSPCQPCPALRAAVSGLRTPSGPARPRPRARPVPLVGPTRTRAAVSCFRAPTVALPPVPPPPGRAGVPVPVAGLGGFRTPSGVPSLPAVLVLLLPAPLVCPPLSAVSGPSGPPRVLSVLVLLRRQPYPAPGRRSRGLQGSGDSHGASGLPPSLGLPPVLRRVTVCDV